MRLVDPETQIALSLTYDADGFPVVHIDTATSGGYYDESGQATIEVYLNQELLRPLFVEAQSSISLSTLKDYLGQFDGNPDVTLLASESDPDAIVLASLFAALA